MGQKQSYIQIGALMLLLAAAVLLNLSTDHSSSSKSATASLADYNLGLFWCILASSISGLSGALVQKAVTGPNPQHSLLYTSELAMYGIVFLLGSSLFSEKDRVVLLSGTLFNGWTMKTFIPVTANVSIPRWLWIQLIIYFSQSIHFHHFI